MSIPPSWREVGLLDICELNPHVERLAPETLVSFFRGSALSDLSGQALPSSIRPYGEASRLGTVFVNGELLIATRGRDMMQATIISGLSTQFGVAQHFLALRPGSDILPAYLLHIIRQPWLTKAARESNLGTQSQLSIRPSFFRNLKMLLPPLDEQQYLVDLLAQASLAPYELALSKALEMSDALALELLVSGDKAQGWPRVTMSTICKFMPSRQRPRESRKPASISLFRLENVDPISGQGRPISVKFEELTKSCSEVKANDVLFTLASNGASGGTAFTIPDNPLSTPFASPAFLVLRPYAGVLPEYLACFMRLSWLGQQLLAMTQGTAGPRLSRSTFERMELPLPPLDQQRAVIRLLKKVPLQQIHQALEKATQLVTALQKEALAGSLSGKWRSQRQTIPEAPARRPDTPPRVGARQQPRWPEPAQRAARAMVAGQLSRFQAHVWEALSQLPFALLIDDQDAVDSFCRSPQFAQYETTVSTVSLRRALEQIATLGLIRRMSIPGTPEGEFMTGFRANRLKPSGRAEEDSLEEDLKRVRDSLAMSNREQ